MTQNIYQKHDAAFSNINAYVIAHNTAHRIERLATIAFKRGNNGTVTCFFHIIGQQMQSGKAGGGGYDKLSAAFYDAASKHLKSMQKGTREGVEVLHTDLELAQSIFKAAQVGNGSSNWDNALRDAGLTILRAV
jgi:hypothetical protein